MDSSTTTQNKRGEWVPAIPLPFFAFPHRHMCPEGAQDCRRWFWTMGGYRGHYALVHILAS